MKVQKFQDLVVWQKAIEPFRLVVRDVERFPRTLVAKIVTDQLISAVSSISANIAKVLGGRVQRSFVIIWG